MQVNGLKEFQELINKINTELEPQMEIWAEEIGIKMVQAVRKEIRARGLVDSRNMINSFMKGSNGNIWEISRGNGVSLEFGSNVDYAFYLEMGYVTKGGSIVYPKSYFTTAMRAIELMIDIQLANKFMKWVL